VRRLVTWVAGAAGGLAAYRAARRRQPEPAAAVEPELDPAEALRAKLAETRVEERRPEGPDDPRRAVHEQARAAIDEMRDET
jgi:hypothetical protein